MDKIKSTIKEGVFKNKEYTLKVIDAKIKLNQNESPFDLPDNLKKEILDRVYKSNWNIYPDFVPIDLYRKIAKYYGFTEKNILLGNGSNEMINTILCATVEKSKKVIIPTPTFTVYKLISTNLNGEIVEVPLNKDLTFNVEKILSETKQDGSITIICSPNNPTGKSMKREDIIKIIENSGGIVVVDEAYIQFGGDSVLDLIEKYENLIVLRTLSKAIGLAGLRLGMMFSNEELIKILGKVKLPYNLDIFSLTTLDVVYDNMEIFDQAAKKIIEEKNKLFIEMKKNPKINFYDSDANFFVLKTENSKYVFDKLLEEEILVRDVSSYPLLDNCLRISIGNSYQNERLLNALNKIFC